ncbi:glycoside hydrolase family 19 protein [Pseudanabaena biceps]|nr:glycoside hydrolase family 19 protein [Pseudanabaena biceps]
METLKSELISAEQLFAIAPNCPTDRLVSLLPYLNDAMAKFDISSRIRKAHFLAQTAHESDGFNTNEEYADGSDYEGWTELGNTQEGDGARFKGRGLIQVTGRANYQECGEALGVDFVDNPKQLASGQYAALSAAWFWDKNKLNAIADDPTLSSTDTCIQITRIVNGGENGLDERLAYLQRALSVL